MTKQHLEASLDWLEKQIAEAHYKDLPYLNATYQKVLEKLVDMDLESAPRDGQS